MKRKPRPALVLTKEALYPYPEEPHDPIHPPDNAHKDLTMTTHFLDDQDIIDPTTIEQTGPSYPVAQWLHGDPKLVAAGGVMHTGGIIIPDKYLSDDIAPAPGWTRTTVAFSSGKSEPVLAAQSPRLAVIRTRFRWFATFNGATTYYPRSGYMPDAGLRGHVQALCGVHGFDDPIVVTFKGKASQEFERLLKEFTDKVRDAVTKLHREKGDKTPAAMPRFAFYMRLAPGPHVKVGQKGQESIITPPTLELPAVLGEDYLSKIYTGRDKLLDLQQDYHNAAEWAAAWDKGATEAEAHDTDLDDDPAERVPAMNGGPRQSGADLLGVEAHFGAGSKKHPAGYDPDM